MNSGEIDSLQATGSLVHFIPVSTSQLQRAAADQRDWRDDRPATPGRCGGRERSALHATQVRERGRGQHHHDGLLRVTIRRSSCH